MKRKLYLDAKNCEKFYELLDKKKELITKALYRVHIPKKLHHEFYNYGLEGLLVSFLILNDGGITEKDFDRFAFTTIKRKLIDEIRFTKTLNIKQTAKSMNISLATAYRLHKRIKETCEKFLMEY